MQPFGQIRAPDARGITWGGWDWPEAGAEPAARSQADFDKKNRPPRNPDAQIRPKHADLRAAIGNLNLIRGSTLV